MMKWKGMAVLACVGLAMGCESKSDTAAQSADATDSADAADATDSADAADATDSADAADATDSADAADATDSADATDATDSADAADATDSADAADATDSADATDAADGACELPQAPRDISQGGGTNATAVAGPGSDAQWLCNVHFHNPQEHAGVGVCPTATVSGDEVCAPEAEEGGEPSEEHPVKAGDVIEVHWVYSSCHPAEAPAPAPGLGLGACVCEGGQTLRVRAQVFVVDDAAGAESIGAPPEGASLASYTGSTTGAQYDDTCSAVGVNWEVAKDCVAVKREALGTWCEGNGFDEKHAHGARELVTDPASLSPYTPAE